MRDGGPVGIDGRDLPRAERLWAWRRTPVMLAPMRIDVDAERSATLALLRRTRRTTGTLLRSLDPDRVVHEEDAWRVRDVVGHLGTWNDEAARSLEAHASGARYTCIESDAGYDEYNRVAVLERREWSIDRVWAEYETSHDRLEAAVEALPADRWDTPVLYPWSELGSAVGLVVLMAEHETTDHCDPIADVAR